MSRRKYTFQQRLEVVMHYFATDEGYRLTSARFNVPRTQVRIWVAAYDAYGEEGLKPRDKGVSIDPDSGQNRSVSASKRLPRVKSRIW
ncbi:helix-turn-helix domain-containing protein [Klebsiella variicola]